MNFTMSNDVFNLFYDIIYLYYESILLFLMTFTERSIKFGVDIIWYKYVSYNNNTNNIINTIITEYNYQPFVILK